MITLAMAKKYTDSQRLVTPATVLSWDGDLRGAELIDGMYKLSGTAYDLNNLESFKLVYGNQDGETTKFEIQEEDGYKMAVVGGATAPMLLSAPGLGLFVFYGSATFYVSEVKFRASTIDPKFLPGVGLPVVEIADIAAITEVESERLTAVANEPYILLHLSAAGVALTMTRIEEGSIYGFNGIVGRQQVMFIYQDNAWQGQAFGWEGL